ncbi:MAG: response regulator, partial [Bordetella sp.]|nr:response regulator [Bordetella sp.]
MTTPDPMVHVVDDDPALRDSLAFMLETNDISTRLYAGAGELLDAAAETALRGCILTDVRMPDMNGIELVRRLRARGVTLPVVVMTGHADVPLAIEAIRAGVQNFIEKPFTDDVLLDALRTALDGSADAAASAADRLVLERLRTLSARERQVLDGLIAGHANKV